MLSFISSMKSWPLTESDLYCKRFKIVEFFSHTTIISLQKTLIYPLVWYGLPICLFFMVFEPSTLKGSSTRIKISVCVPLKKVSLTSENLEYPSKNSRSVHCAFSFLLSFVHLIGYLINCFWIWLWFSFLGHCYILYFNEH